MFYIDIIFKKNPVFQMKFNIYINIYIVYIIYLGANQHKQSLGK
jgi:hypothetical protein